MEVFRGFDFFSMNEVFDRFEFSFQSRRAAADPLLTGSE